MGARWSSAGLSESPERPTSKFGLTELAISVAVIAVCIALLLPAMNSARGGARTSQCLNAQREIGIALRYASANRSQAIRSSNWITRLVPYLNNQDTLLFCPADLSPQAASSFGMNDRAHEFQGGDGRKIVLMDYHKTEIIAVASWRDEQDDWPLTHAARHNGRVNVLHFDGAVATYDPDTIDPRYCANHDNYWRPFRESSVVLQDCLGSAGLP